MRFKEACEATDFDFTFEQGPGSHGWEYWDGKIKDVLAWLPLKK